MHENTLENISCNMYISLSDADGHFLENYSHQNIWHNLSRKVLYLYIIRLIVVELTKLCMCSDNKIRITGTL